MGLRAIHGNNQGIALCYDATNSHFYLTPDNNTTLFAIAVNPIILHSQMMDAGTFDNTNGNPIFVAPFAMTLIGVTARARVKSSATETIDLLKVASGTALASGTTLLDATQIDADGITNNTNETIGLTSTTADLDIAAGALVGLLGSGTLTALLDLTVTLNLKPTIAAVTLPNQ